MCLSIVTAPDSATFECRGTIFLSSPTGTDYVLTTAITTITNTWTAECVYVHAHVAPAHAEILQNDHIEALVDLKTCEYANTLCVAPTYTNTWDTPNVGGIVYRSMGVPAVPQLHMPEVEVKLAPGGCFQVTLPTPLPCMQKFFEDAMGGIPSDATPEVIVAALHAINDELAKPEQLGQTGFRPVAVPTAERVLDDGAMDTYQADVQDRMISACTMLVVKMAFEKILSSCGDLAPVILKEIFSGTPTDSTFDVSRRFDKDGRGLDEMQLSAMRIRDTICQHIDCNYVMFCTSMVKPGESIKAVMTFQTKRGEEVPFPFQCHEDGNHTTETNVVLASHMVLDMSRVSVPGKDTILRCMDKDHVWNAKPEPPAHAQPPTPGTMTIDHGFYSSSYYDDKVRNEQREARIFLMEKGRKDKMAWTEICAAARVEAGIKLSQRVVSLPCTVLE